MSAREPLQIVEIRQPRCSLRFGQWPCPAALKQGVKRTNLVTRSQEFNNAIWVKDAVTVTADAGAAPGGAMTAESLVETAANATHRLRETSISFTSGDVYTYSVFIKNLSGSRNVIVAIAATPFGALQSVNVNPTTGVVNGHVGGGSVVVESLGSGWYRVALTTIAASVTGTTPVYLGLASGTGTGVATAYLGDGTSGVLIFGAQIEAGAGASTYKPTAGAAVSALWGTANARCYNTWSTCPSGAPRAAFLPDGRMRWRFVANRPGRFDFGDFSDPDDVATHCIPVSGLSVSTARAQVNVSGILEGSSALGVLGGCTVSMPDFVWDDRWGDFYLDDRVDLPKRMFWAVWAARNMFYGGMEIVIYDGFYGDALVDMRQRLYTLEKVDGPSSSGSVTITGLDPMIQLEGKTSQFPAAMDVKLVNNITASDTTIRVVTSEETNLTKAYGISTYPGIIIGSEIILYDGYTSPGAGEYDLAVIERGALGTTAADAEAESRVQRIGWFEDAITWECAEHLIAEHTPLGASAIGPNWQTEGDLYLPNFRSDVVITAPTSVKQLVGEICQQGMFFIWWNQYEQIIDMQAVRPPQGTVQELDGTRHILAGSAQVRRDPKGLLTRVFVYYGAFDLTKVDKANMRVVDGTVEAITESPAAAGKPYSLEIVARWVKAASHAQILVSRILSRYRTVPRFMTVHVSAKDRSIGIGYVADVTTKEILDTEGRPISERWQVISWDEVKQGEVYLLDMQTYDLFGRFGRWMADGSPDYTAATVAERETGSWWADDSGQMSDGSDGYQWQ